MRGVTFSGLLLGVLVLFQPALPMRGVTKYSCIDFRKDVFQPALPMRGVTIHIDNCTLNKKISTRTPHAGSDWRFLAALRLLRISTRTPHAGSDKMARFPHIEQSDFNPHSPCGE